MGGYEGGSFEEGEGGMREGGDKHGGSVVKDSKVEGGYHKSTFGGREDLLISLFHSPLCVRAQMLKQLLTLSHKRTGN